VPPLGNAELPALTAADKMLLARVCQAAENQFVGVNCGLLDHISSLYGQADHVILIDCLKLAVDWTPFSGDIAVVVCHSGVRHALVGGEYNERRRNCEGAARALGAPSLRFVNLASLENGRSRLTPAQYSCALHVVGENDRVQRGAGMLRSGDIASFGQLLFQSHESSRHNFHNSCPELDVLVELANTQAACLGARLTGGGFGGATINLVKRDAAEEFRTRMAAGYAAKTGHKLESWICSVVDGAA
jgi:galactokinase